MPAKDLHLSGSGNDSTAGVPPMVRFSIKMVFDLKNRAGLLASGILTGGPVRAGMTLRDEVTGKAVRVLGVEFETPRDRETGQTTLLLERTTPSPVRIGTVLAEETT